jgi:serine protease Do
MSRELVVVLLTLVAMPSLAGTPPVSQGSFVAAVQLIMPAVVGIGVDQREARGLGFASEGSSEPVRKYYQPDAERFRQQAKPQWSQKDDPITADQIAVHGSGFFATPEGLVLTARHVVAEMRRVYVLTHDNRVFRATVVAQDEANDLALLRVEGGTSRFATIALGDSDALSIAEPVFAVGSPFGFNFSVTSGIVSAKDRVFGEVRGLIQTDAAVNPGNSGGPLLNSTGEVIGINHAIASVSPNESVGWFIGLGFAIPINPAKALLNRRDTSLDATLRVGPEGELVVAGVEAGGAAARAGLAVGDVIIAVDGREFGSVEDLEQFVKAKGAKQTVSARILRGGRRYDVSITLGDGKR